MKKNAASISDNSLIRINQFIEENDIRILVFAPPIIAFAGLLLGVFVINLLSDGHPYQPITDLLLGTVLLFPCFSGYAEIYKREMPGPFGGIIKGTLAVLSGWFIIILFGIGGVAFLLHGISTLL
jgi:hypothetical protein